MPKTIIDSKFFGQKTETGGPVEPTHAHVGWTKGLGHVELGVINDAVESAGAHDPISGWFMQLDRDGCNRLIRAVRLARDQAFGKDE